MVQTTNERITDLVSSLKNFTRLDEAEYKEADLHQGLDSTLTLLRHEIGPTIEVIKEYGAIPSIRCYPGELNQTFMALLRNAIHAIEESGIITLATACMDATITIKITDTGKGMTGEQRAALFDLDFTTRDDRVGIGMGLFSAYTTIQKHKGKIDIESEVGRGTVFTITLPRETP